MTAPLKLRLEPARRLALREERGLLEQALERNPGNAALRAKLAAQLIEVDDFARAIAVLTSPGAADLDYKSRLKLAKCHYARGDAEGDGLARAAAERALEIAANKAEQALAMSDMAKADLRAGRNDAAKCLLQQALALDPHCIPAFRRLSLTLFREGRFDEMLALSDEAWAAGVRQVRVLTSTILPLVRLGRLEEARTLSGIPGLVRHRQLQAPQPWRDMADFNAQVAAELLANVDRRYEAYGVASQRTHRVDTPCTGDTPAIAALLEMLVAEVEAFAASLADVDNRWAEAISASGTLKSWAVHPDAQGYEKWHLHPNGWMSGGYYVAVPDKVVEGDGREGCIAFGLPETMVGEEAAAAFGEHVIRPEAGALVLFPSSTYHRTFAHGAEGERICLAFDIVPD